MPARKLRYRPPRLGCQVALYEMRPTRSTEAHQTADFAELVCSNSLKSESENTAPWLLKQEMRRAGSALLREADASAVPAGHALAVDRVEFSRRVAARIAAEPASPSTAKRSPHSIPTSPTRSPSSPPAHSPAPRSPPRLQRLTGSNHLAFYDSISPIVDATTIDMDRVYFAARYDKGTADYINCPFTKEEYDRFLDALTTAESVPVKPWEADARSLLSSRSEAEGLLHRFTHQLPCPTHNVQLTTCNRIISKAVSPSKRRPAEAATPSALAP